MKIIVDGVEVDDGLTDDAGNPLGADTDAEDRGDNLPDDVLEVDEDIVAALAKDDDTNRSIPKSRFDEVNNEKNDLKAQNAILLAQIAAGTTAAVPAVAAAVPAVEEFDLDAKESAYAEALTEGDLEGAAVLRKEIRAFERKSLLAELRDENSQATVQKTVEDRKNAVIAQAFTDHPELNHKDPAFDAVLVGKVNRMQNAYMAEGKSADEALKLAIDDFVKPPVVIPEVVDKGDAAARARNAKAAGAQPPGLKGVGTGARAAADASVDVAGMTDAEYDALPEREKKRLRGD